MDLKAFDAASAYGKAATGGIGAAVDFSGLTKSSGSGGGSSFGDLLNSMVGDMSKATRNSEATAVKSINDKAGVVDVVSDVSNAEMVVNTVVAVRDKVIQAYQEIMRMPI